MAFVWALEDGKISLRQIHWERMPRKGRHQWPGERLSCAGRMRQLCSTGETREKRGWHRCWVPCTCGWVPMAVFIAQSSSLQAWEWGGLPVGAPEINTGEEPAAGWGERLDCMWEAWYADVTGQGHTLERSNGMEKEGRMRHVLQREKWPTGLASSSRHRAQSYRERSKEHSINTRYLQESTALCAFIDAPVTSHALYK